MAEAEGMSSLAKGLLLAAGASGVGLTIVLAIVVSRVLSSVVRLVLPSKIDSQSKGKGKSSSKAPALLSSSEAPKIAVPAGKERGPDLKALIRDSKVKQTKQASNKDDQATHHHLFLNTLKGHGDTIHSASWSADGMHIVTSCEDMLVRVFDMTDVTSREPKFKRIKAAKLPIGAGFGDSSESVGVLMRGIPDGIMAGYLPSTQKESAAAFEEVWSAPQLHGKEPPLMMRSAPGSTGRHAIFVSCSTKKDVRVYSARGREIGILEPNSLVNHDLAVSPDGRFVAVASFTAEVRIWEVKRTRDTGDFAGCFKAMELKGHKSQVHAVAFSPDSKKAVTASKDGTLRVWNIDVRFALEEDPKTTLVISMPLSQGRCYQQLAFGPKNIIAASTGGVVHLLSAANGELLDTIDAHEGDITSMQWCPRLLKTSGNLEAHPVLATSSKDKRVRLWRAEI